MPDTQVLIAPRSTIARGGEPPRAINPAYQLLLVAVVTVAADAHFLRHAVVMAPVRYQLGAAVMAVVIAHHIAAIIVPVVVIAVIIGMTVVAVRIIVVVVAIVVARADA